MSSTSLPPDDAHDAGHAPGAERLEHDEVRYDTPEIAVYRIVAVLAGILAVFIGITIVCVFLLRLNRSSEDEAAPQAQYTMPRDRLPGGPRLEPLDRSTVTEWTDVFGKQLAMEHALDRYGITDDPAFVHIPIKQAMRLVLPTLTVRQKDAQPPAKGFGLFDDGEPNSGRLYSEAPPWLRGKK